jgi:hypothetical protein
MRSIRLSLIVYLLVFLALALGVASVLVYRTTKQTLLDKKAIIAGLLQTQYLESCR